MSDKGVLLNSEMLHFIMLFSQRIFRPDIAGNVSASRFLGRDVKNMECVVIVFMIEHPTFCRSETLALGPYLCCLYLS